MTEPRSDTMIGALDAVFSEDVHRNPDKLQKGGQGPIGWKRGPMAEWQRGAYRLGMRQPLAVRWG